MAQPPSLARNFGLNLLGNLLPLLVALVAIPVLIDHFGVARFGLLTLGWSLVGYFSLFDLGVGRALTQRLSALIGTEQLDQIGGTFWTAITLMLVLGLLGGLTLALSAAYLAEDLLKLPVALQADARQTFYVLAAAVPIVVLSTALRGAVEAHQRFDLIFWVRLPLGIATFGGPLLVIPYTNDLTPAIIVVVAARALGAIAFLGIARRIQPRFHRPVLDFAKLKPLARFGGWMTVTNIVGPIMGFLDRFFIGAIRSVAAVTYYATPWEFINRLLIIPGTLLNVLFPALASAYERGSKDAAVLFENANRYVLLSLFPIVACLFTFAQELLGVWLDPGFAQISAPIAKILLLGMFVNASGSVSSTLIQSAGRPDLTARVHLVELPVYLVILYYLINQLGAVGAAIAWSLRNLVDAGVLQYLARSLLGENSVSRLLHWGGLLGCAMGLVCIPLLIEPLSMRLGYVTALIVLYFFVGWTWLLSQNDRAFIKKYLPGNKVT